MELSLIVAVYNGEKTISKLYAKVSEALEAGIDWELIFVYDCGKDQSWDIIKKIASENQGRVRAFRLARNYGQHSSLLFGMHESRGRYVATLDEDLQHDPKYISAMLEEIKKGKAEVVYGQFSRLKHPGLRIATSEMFRKVLKRITPGLFPEYSPLRLISASVAERISQLRYPYAFIDGYLGMVTDKFGVIDCEHQKRTDGKSSYTYIKLFRHAMYIAITYSPIKRWLLLSSLLTSFVAFILFVTSKHNLNGQVFHTLAVILATAGLGFLALAIVAEVIHFRGLRNNNFPVAVERI